MTAQKHQNNYSDALLISAGGFEIEQQYRQCAEILFAAILREPHNFALYASRMSPVWWKETAFDRCAVSVFEQFYGPARSYSIRTVCVASGIPLDEKPNGQLCEPELYRICGLHNDTELAPALEMFEPIYRQWVEFRVAQFAQAGILKGWEAEQIRSEQDNFRRERCAYMTQQLTRDEWFETWFEMKMQGMEIDYPCKPALQTVIQSRMCIGYEPGALYIIAGSPGTGKTFYFLGDMLRFLDEGSRGVFVSLDMNARMVKMRLIQMITGYGPDDDWSILTDEQRAKIEQAKQFAETMPVTILDKMSDVDQIVAACYAEHFKNPIHFLCIDFIQNVTVSRSERRDLGISEICRKLKMLANMIDIPVIALSQLSRDVQKRGGSRRPILSDLKDSSGLEQEADVVIFLHRPEMNGMMEDEYGNSTKGIGEVIFAKQRMRKVGDIRCGFSETGRGWHDLDETPKHNQGQTIPKGNSYTDYTIPASAMQRPGVDNEEIPF